MRYREYTISADVDDNELYIFHPYSDRLKKYYKTEITIDGLMDNLLVSSTCSCDGFLMRKTCKHVRDALEILKRDEVEYVTA